MRIHKGDTVCHFKRETLAVKQIEENDYLYMYKILLNIPKQESYL